MVPVIEIKVYINTTHFHKSMNRVSEHQQQSMRQQQLRLRTTAVANDNDDDDGDDDNDITTGQ